MPFSKKSLFTGGTGMDYMHTYHHALCPINSTDCMLYNIHRQALIFPLLASRVNPEVYIHIQGFDESVDLSHLSVRRLLLQMIRSMHLAPGRSGMMAFGGSGGSTFLVEGGEESGGRLTELTGHLSQVRVCRSASVALELTDFGAIAPSCPA